MEESVGGVDFEECTRYIPNAFASGVAQVPNNPLIAATFAAIFKGGPKARTLIGGWRIGQDGVIRYRHIGRRGGEIVIYFDVTAGETLNPGAIVQKQIALIEALKPLTADTLLAILAQICERSTGSRSYYPLITPVPISSNAVLKYKGVKRWGWERSEMRKRVKCELELLSRLRFDVLQFPGWDPTIKRWNHKGVSCVGGKIFNVIENDETTVVLNGRERLLDDTWTVSIGHWGRWWLNAQAKVWLGEIPQNLIEFDHRTNRGAAVLAKKVGISINVLLDALKSRSYVERRIDHLLEATGELPIMEARESHWAGRMRDRLTDALLHLQETGVFRRIAWLSSGDTTEFDRYGELDRNKGWVERWLGSKIRFYRRYVPLLADSDASAKPSRRNRRRKRPATNFVSGEISLDTGRSIRRQRIVSGMSQFQLAEKLKISNGHLSKIENEKVPVTNEIKERVVAYFGMPSSG
jgi:DNA-binding XRE family transcriptional regulator